MKYISTFICIISFSYLFSQTDSVSVSLGVVPVEGVNQIQLDFWVSDSTNLGELTIRAYEPGDVNTPVFVKLLSQTEYSILNNHFLVYLSPLDPLNSYLLFIESQNSYGDYLESTTLNYVPN